MSEQGTERKDNRLRFFVRQDTDKAITGGKYPWVAGMELPDGHTIEATYQAETLSDALFHAGKTAEVLLQQLREKGGL